MDKPVVQPAKEYNKWFVYEVTTVLSIGSFIFGYDIGIMAGA